MTASEWFAPTEGILFDTRIEGSVTGAHLFGDQNGAYTDGFEKLALLGYAALATRRHRDNMEVELAAMLEDTVS